jgi:hypothetical protein
LRFLSRGSLVVAVAICVFNTGLTGFCVSTNMQNSVGISLRDFIAPCGALAVLLAIVSLVTNRIWPVLSTREAVVSWLLLVAGVALTFGGIVLVTD